MSNGASYNVPDRTRSIVFTGLCNAEVSVRCYQDEHRKHTKPLWGWLVSAPYFAPLLMTAYQNAWNLLCQGAQIFLSLVPLSGMFIVRRKDGYKGAVAHFVRSDCEKVVNEMRTLLDDIDANALLDQEARERFSVSLARLNAAVNNANLAKITISKSKRRKVQKEVVEEFEGIYNG